MDLGSVGTAASTIVALSGISAWAVQRDSLKVVREQNGDLRADVADKDRRHEEDQRRINKMLADIEALRGLVTNEVLVQAISDLLDHHHRRSEEQWGEEQEILREIRDRGRRTDGT